MARQSIPANPVDEQILALQRTIANNQNELETMKEQFEEQLEAQKQIIQQQTEQITKLIAEKEQLAASISSQTNEKVESEKELRYLQEQLEILSREKAELAEKASSAEELQRVAMDNEALKGQLLLAQARIAEVEGQLEEVRLLQNPSRIPPGEAVLRLRQMQERVQALTLSLRSQ